MQVHATTNKTLFHKPTEYGWDIVEVKSKSDPSKKYRVDITFGRCSCPAWKFSKPVDGVRQPCKHLRALGFKAVAPDLPELKEYKKSHEPKIVQYEGEM